MKEMLVNFVLDETGSMDSCRDATISGFNGYVRSLQEQSKRIRFTLIKFNGKRITVVCSDEDIRNVKELNRSSYIPTDATPLNDAVAYAIKEIENKLRERDESPDVLCVIMTDGEENASQKYTTENIFNLIRLKQEEGWTFVYLGANQDARTVGRSLGLRLEHVSGYNTARTQQTFNQLSHMTQTYIDNGLINMMEDFDGTNKR